MGNNSRDTQCSVMGFQLCNMSHCKKHAHLVMTLARNALQINQRETLLKNDKSVVYQKREKIKNKRNKVELRFLCTTLQAIARNIHTWFGVEPIVTKFRSGQEMRYKNQRGIIKKRNKLELRFLCTALNVFARNMHTKFGVIWTYDDKVTLWTRKSGRRRRRRPRRK